MRISRYLSALAVVAAVWISPVFADDNAQTFADKAAVGGMFEVE